MADDKKNVIDEEDAEARRALNNAGIPVTWHQAGQGLSRESIVGPERRLVEKLTPQQVNLFSRSRVRTCGQCKHFRLSYFQQVKSAFMRRLVIEHEWRPEFIGDHPTKMGRCMQDESLVVGPNSLGCDAFKPK